MAKIKKDTNLRKAILQAAITGKLISNVDGATETGKQLLERIIEERKKMSHGLDFANAKSGKRKSKKETVLAGSNPCGIPEDQIPFEIPESWCWCRLGEICNAQLGKTLDKSKNKGDEVPYLCSINVNWGQIDLEKVKTLKLEESEKTKYLLKKGDLLICEGGDVGRAAIWDLEKEMYYQNALHCVRFYLNLNQKYFYYILVQYKNLGILDKVSKGMTIKHLVQGALLNLIVPLPPLAVQNGSVAKLEEVLPLVDAYENAVLQKEELKTALPDKVKKAILQEAIQGKLTEDWRKSQRLLSKVEAIETGKQLLDRIIEERNAKLLADWEEAKKKNPKAKKPAPIVASEIDEDAIPFEIPESWCWCRLSNLCNLYTGNSINETEKKLKYTNIKDGWVYIGTKDVGFDQTINYDNGIKIPFEKDTFRIAPKNTVLMCIEGGSAGRKIAFTNQDVCFGNKLCCFNPYKYEVEKFLFYFLQSTVFTDAFKDNINGIIGGVSINKIKDMLFPLPPLAEQEKIVEIIEQMLPLCEKLERKENTNDK